MIFENLKVKIKKITKYSQERTIDGMVYIQGVCEATTNGNSFEFDFMYKGKSSEDKQKIMDYLKKIAIQKLIEENNESKQNTLGDLVNKYYKGEKTNANRI